MGGDTNCDDENNNKNCDWDGGDCCGPAVKKTYCKVCKCLDPKPKIGCAVPAYKGDGNCDDGNNIKECDYDGGDCCLAKIVKTYCKICKCKDPKAGCKGTCKSKAYVGDGNCDDENNNCGCKYDGVTAVSQKLSKLTAKTALALTRNKRRSAMASVVPKHMWATETAMTTTTIAVATTTVAIAVQKAAKQL